LFIDSQVPEDAATGRRLEVGSQTTS
jgi:hypothetical protein